MKVAGHVLTWHVLFFGSTRRLKSATESTTVWSRSVCINQSQPLISKVDKRNPFHGRTQNVSTQTKVGGNHTADNGGDLADKVKALLTSDLEQTIKHDLCLYELKSTGYMWKIHLMAVGTFLFAMYFAIFLYVVSEAYGKKVSIDSQQSRGYQLLAWFSRLFSEDGIWWSGGIGLFAVTELVLCTLFIRRSVHTIILLRGGKRVQLKLFNGTPMLNSLRTITLNLNEMSCTKGRAEGGNFLPLQIKNDRISYVIDKSGLFRNPALFDTTVGMSRHL